ncbi:potassium channel family protein [Leptospira ilyithenensis]|uniref:TrkA family potassium uptake protein n=1 Tax=Leptospira ilyithenensis TaxID=2484901 RepID=A0A4R9LPR2_9LEPT|nr:TrkA family potassium uptake protein [Leptospira ilyithenensis]TGN11074.1 TrkA family potassium uptake protein [Leptospira ilyithenensis]
MQKKKIAVIGIGSFGKLLARYLFAEGHEVLAIDKKEDVIQEIKDHCTVAVTLDATDESALRSQGIEDLDIVVLAIADDFETSTICADLLKKMGAKNIYARYQTDLQIRIFHLLGIKNIFNPEEQAARSMAEILGFSGMKANFLLSDEYSVSEVVVPKRYINKTVGEIDLRQKYEINIITIKRPIQEKDKKRSSDSTHGRILGIPEGDMILKENDTLVIFASQKNINRFLEG